MVLPPELEVVPLLNAELPPPPQAVSSARTPAGRRRTISLLMAPSLLNVGDGHIRRQQLRIVGSSGVGAHVAARLQHEVGLADGEMRMIGMRWPRRIGELREIGAERLAQIGHLGPAPGN